MADYTVTKQIGVVITLIILHWGCCKNNNCDVNHCKSLFSTVFKDFFKKGTQRLCRSSDDTIECIDKCLGTFFPHFDLINSNTAIASKVCSDDFEYDLNQHWNCISRHFHRLVTCMSISGSVAPSNNSSKTLKLLSCRKLLEVMNCPYQVLNDCEDEAVERVNDLFINIFKSSMGLACYPTPSNVVFDLPVTYSLNNSYLSTATCLDSLPDIASSCFSQYFQSFETTELDHCRQTCKNLDTETCLSSSVMRDFYIPILSFGKHLCEKDLPVEDQFQMQEPSNPFTVSHYSDITSENKLIEITDATQPTNKIHDLIPSDGVIGNNALSTDYSNIETSTLSYKLNSKEAGHNEVLSTIHSSSNFHAHTSVIPTKQHPEINSFVPRYAVDKTTENGVSRLDLQYLVLFLAVLIFLEYTVYVK